MLGTTRFTATVSIDRSSNAGGRAWQGLQLHSRMSAAYDNHRVTRRCTLVGQTLLPISCHMLCCMMMMPLAHPLLRDVVTTGLELCTLEERTAGGAALLQLCLDVIMTKPETNDAATPPSFLFSARDKMYAFAVAAPAATCYNLATALGTVIVRRRRHCPIVRRYQWQKQQQQHSKHPKCPTGRTHLDGGS